MALTTTQVNQAFLATLGRPAEGSAATWGSTSLSLDALLDSIFIAENTDGDFVEYLYQNILGRASDAEGKAFWNSLLATTSKEAVLAQFKAAVIAAGQADPANADYQSFIAQNKAFVTELYTNLLGRSDAASADAEGVEFWANALASGTSRGDLLAQFTAAVLANPNSDDAQALNAKVTVANAITAKFNNFNADVTADQKKAALDELKATMTEVVAGSTAEDFQERIDTFAGNYQNRVAQVFTTKDDDQLDASEATASTVFSGNVNLIDSTKGTIQTTDSVTGNSNYTDTLRVSVTSDSANKDFSLGSNLPTSVSSIEKLIITAGAANVSGNLDGNNYAESTTITSTGDVDLKIVGGVQKELKVTAGDKKDAAITVNSGSLDNYTGSAAKDTINVNAGSVKTIDTGAGKDTVDIKGGSIQSEGSIKLGAGDDELTIGATLKLDKDTLNKISLDGGEGSKDKLTISTDITAVNSITGFETITTTGTSAKISADAANSLTSGTKLSDSSKLTIDMSDKNSLNLKNLKVGNTTDNKPGKAAVDVLNVAKGEITLTTTTNNAIVETITLDKTATDGTTGTVTIKGIGAAPLESGNKKAGTFGDKLAIDGMTTASSFQKVENYNKLSGALDTSKVYYINTAISSADDLASKSTVLAFMDNNTTLASGKVLVALNNSAQNKSYVFEIKAGTGNANAITRDDITLKAIVDNAINSKDKITGGAIEFVAGTEAKDVKPAGVSNEVKYEPTAQELTPNATGTTYNNKTITYSGDKIKITDVTGELTVSGTGSDASGKTVEAIITTASGKVTKSNANGATVDVYLGDGNEVDLSTKANSDLVNGVDNVYAGINGTITLKTADKFDGGKTLDMSKTTTTKVVINDAITATASGDLAGFLSNVKATQFVEASVASALASPTTVKLTGANDTIKFTSTNTNKASLENFNKAGTDKISLSGLSAELTAAKVTAVQAKDTNAANVLDATKIFTITAIADDLTVVSNITLGTSNGNVKTTVTQSASYLIAITNSSKTKTAIYEAKSTDNATLATSEIKLIAEVDANLTENNSWLA